MENSTFKRKLILVVSGFSVIFMFAMLAIVNYSTNGIVKMVLANNNVKLTEYIASEVDIEKLELLAQNVEDGALFREQHEALAQFLEANKLTYTLVTTAGDATKQNTVLIDASPLSEEDTYMIGDESDGLNYEELKLATEEGTFYEYAYFEGWGEYLSVYVPLKNKNGETFAILSTDEQIDFVTSFQNKAFRQSLLLMGAVILVITLVVLALIFTNIYSFLRPIKQMRQAAGHMEDNDLKTTLMKLNETDLEANDDVSTFGRSFKEALEKLGEMVGALNNMTTDIDRTTNNLQHATEDVKDTQQMLHTKSLAIHSTIDQQVDLNKQSVEVTGEMETFIGTMNETVASIGQSLLNTSMLIHTNVRQADMIAEKVQNAAHHMTTTSEQVQELANRYLSIEEMISIIQNIAEDTKLLALNAAIEAANAGKQGEGFSVIADEVKTLSMITMEAAEDIRKQIIEFKDLTNDMLKEIEETTEDVQGGAERVTSIHENLQHVLSATTIVQENVAEMSNLTKQIGQGVIVMHRDLQHADEKSEGIQENTVLVVKSVEVQQQSFEQLTKTVIDLNASLRTLEKSMSQYTI